MGWEGDKLDTTRSPLLNRCSASASLVTHAQKLAAANVSFSQATTLTITECPGGCTIKRPVTTIASVICNNNW